MSELLLVLTVILPLALVAVWPLRSCRAWVGRFAVGAPLPALLTAVFANELTVELPWLLLGSRWGLDVTGRVFLGFTATLWLAAGIFARSYLTRDRARDRFELFHLLTMAGNLGLIVAQDMVSFLLFFTLMSLAAYGLITHHRKPDSMRAGRAYIILAVFGEVLLFWAVILAAQQTGTLHFDGLAAKLAVSPLRQVIVGLLLVGFGIKLGLMPLHFWLPLAHPVAPTPASAVTCLAEQPLFAQCASSENGNPVGRSHHRCRCPVLCVANSRIRQANLGFFGPRSTVGCGLADNRCWSNPVRASRQTSIKRTVTKDRRPRRRPRRPVDARAGLVPSNLESNRRHGIVVLDQQNA